MRPSFSFTLMSVLLAAPLHSACSSACGGEKDDEVVTHETGQTDLERGVYASADWHSNWDYFPGGRTINFKHGLGVTPEIVNTYVSFEQRGLIDKASASENAGNQGVIQCVDSDVIRVYNDTCAKFYLRVVAMASRSGEVSDDPALSLERCQ